MNKKAMVLHIEILAVYVMKGIMSIDIRKIIFSELCQVIL